MPAVGRHKPPGCAIPLREIRAAKTPSPPSPLPKGRGENAVILTSVALTARNHKDKAVLIRLVIIFILLAVNLSAWWFGIMAPDMTSIEFTDHDVWSLLNQLPLVNVDVSGEPVSYRASHLEWLGLLASWPLLLLFGTRSLTDFKLWQRIVSCVVRVALIATIVLALVDIEKTEESQQVSMVYLVDVSDSVPDAMLAEAQQVIDSALKSRGDSKTTLNVQVVTYAATPRVVETESDAVQLRRHDETGSAEQQATDIEAAIRFASSLFPENYQRRLVLMGDGNQTQGDALGQAARAAQDDIRIDVVHLTMPERHEILLHGFETRDRDNLRVGKPFEVVASLESTKAMTVQLDVSLDGVHSDKLSQSVDVQPGLNEIPLVVTSDHPGKLNLSAELAGVAEGDDTFAANNAIKDTFEILGRPKVLYIESDTASAQYLQRALAGWGDSEGQNFDVDVRPPSGWPTSMSELSKYAVVILGDVARVTNTGRTNITSENMKLLESYVRRQSGGFIALGGSNAFSLGGYKDTIIENILPVKFDADARNEKMTSAIAFVIDKSGSMRENRNLEMAKEAAKQSVATLKPQDRVMVIGFDDAPYLVVPATRAVNRYSINDKISRMQPNGGTNIRDALELAYLELSLVSAKVKHVIVLTDGHSPYTGIDALVKEMSRSKITVSTIALSKADTVLLSRIASLGKGRAYIANDPTSVPRLFVEETDRIVNNAVVESPFVPKVAKQHAMVKGVTPQTLLGYVETKPKNGSEVILTAPTGSPILAHWNVGTGSTTAFTSDAKNRWASGWIKQSSSFAKFWAQVVRETMNEEEETLYAMTTRLDQSRAYVIVDAIDTDDSFINGLDVTASVQPPEGDAFNLTFEQAAPGYYEASFDVSSYGAYAIRAELKQQNESLGYAQSSLSYPYSPEYAAMAPNTPLMDAMAAATHGYVDVDFAQMSDPGDVKLRSYTPLWANFLWLAFGLIILDVAVRRIR